MLVLRHQFDELEEVESKVSTGDYERTLVLYEDVCKSILMSYALTILGAPCPRRATRLPSAMSR